MEKKRKYPNISKVLKEKYANDEDFYNMHINILSKNWTVKRPCWKTGLNKEISEGIRKSIESQKATIAKKQKEGLSNGGHHKPHSEEAKKKISIARKEMWITYSDEKKHELIKNRSIRKEPSGPETQFQKEYIDKYNLPYIYVGNVRQRTLIIKGKIPDFVHTSEKKLIEIYGDYYHKGHIPEDRINFFKENGYKCIVIWASELNKEETLSKVLEFTKEGR